jgi:hypothetical protein
MAAAHLCGGHAGAIKGKSPSANVRAFAGGDFCICQSLVQELAFGIKDFVIEKNGQTN